MRSETTFWVILLEALANFCVLFCRLGMHGGTSGEYRAWKGLTRYWHAKVECCWLSRPVIAGSWSSGIWQLAGWDASNTPRSLASCHDPHPAAIQGSILIGLCKATWPPEPFLFGCSKVTWLWHHRQLSNSNTMLVVHITIRVKIVGPSARQ